MADYDAGDPKLVEKKKKKYKLKKETDHEYLRSVLSKYEGRAFLWELLSKCGIYDVSFRGDNSLTFFNEGRRSVGLELIALIEEVEPFAISRIRDEAIERSIRGNND